VRIDLGTRATQSVGNAATDAAAGSAGKPAGDVGAQQDTAQFLFERVKTQALAPDSAPQIEAGRLRIDALRKVLADGSYNVPPELIAGALVAEARV